MSEITKATAKTKAIQAGAKPPADRKKAASAKVKAMQAEAGQGDMVVEVRGEALTVHVRAYQDRMSDDYEFMEMASVGLLPAMLRVLLDQGDIDRLKDLARNEETGTVSTVTMSEIFQELMEAVGQGN